MAEYDHERATMGSYHTITGEVFPKEGEPVLRLDCEPDRITGRTVLSCTSSCLLLRGAALEFFQQEIAEEVSIKPVGLFANGVAVEGFCFVKPLQVWDCLDRGASKIDWIWKGRYVSRIHSLVLTPDCLSGSNFVRDEATSLLLVSDHVKQAMERIDKNAFVALPPDKVAYPH